MIFLLIDEGAEKWAFLDFLRWLDTLWWVFIFLSPLIVNNNEIIIVIEYILVTDKLPYLPLLYFHT